MASKPPWIDRVRWMGSGLQICKVRWIGSGLDGWSQMDGVRPANLQIDLWMDRVRPANLQIDLGGVSKRAALFQRCRGHSDEWRQSDFRICRFAGLTPSTLSPHHSFERRHCMPSSCRPRIPSPFLLALAVTVLT